MQSNIFQFFSFSMSGTLIRPFNLCFNMLMKDEGILARNYCVDILVDLLRSDKIRQSLLKYIL